MASLAVKYRPQTFEDVCSQQSIIKVLRQQIELKKPSNCYLFCGGSGCGKTTIARIFAHKLNEYTDIFGNTVSSEPIEIDGASNNGVDNVRSIIDEARTRSLDGKYKVFVIDECHMLTIQSWNAFLKCIEEPPAFTVFIFCTTDPQKIPDTIINRVMRFNLTKVKLEEIENRLKYICKQEGFTNYEESCAYISKLSCGGVRDAISMLEKCAGYSTDLNINNVLTSLGNFSYETMFNLTNSIIDGKERNVVEILDDIYNRGFDLKLFVNTYFEFLLDLNKYCLFNSMEVVKIPSSMEELIKYTTGIDNNTKYFNALVNHLLKLHNEVKNDVMFRTTITVTLLTMCRGL